MADLRQQSYNAIDAVYNQTLDAIKRIQGDNPYVETQADGNDRMYFIAYEDTNCQNVVEGIILGVRAVGDEIQILGYLLGCRVDQIEESGRDDDSRPSNINRQQHRSIAHSHFRTDC